MYVSVSIIDAQKLATLRILLGMVDTNNERKPIDVKEHNRQRAWQWYAQMDKQKKDELLKKCCEAYQQKKVNKWVT
jgi:hypothetical protein